MEKFKSDPYNSKNRLITKEEIYNLFSELGLMNHDYFHKTYKLTRLDLYQRAFIHTSYTKLKDYKEYENTHNYLELQDLSYEKIEFLGDAILGSIISAYLYNRYVDIHDQCEGFLTKIKIKLICGEQLAYLSKCIGFGKYVIISEHIDRLCDGRNNKNILEDTFEAFIGALYLDTQDIKLVEIFIITIVEKLVDFSDMILNDTNYKDQLLKYYQHNYKCNPIYNTSKSNDGEFTCHITFKDPDTNIIECICKSTSTSKKKSEQMAAKKALIKYHVISD
tara:strand:- start:605 stop:1438 length:834 start_codon:yes stop_codon:yes gene_type:complete